MVPLRQLILRAILLNSLLLFTSQLSITVSAVTLVNPDPTDEPLLICKREVTQVSAYEFVVKLQFSKDNLTGFGKVEEAVPYGFEATEMISSNGIFSFQENKVKILWMTLPEKDEITLEYKLNGRYVQTGDYNIAGNASVALEHREKEVQTAPSSFHYHNKLLENENERDRLARLEREQRDAQIRAKRLADQQREALAYAALLDKEFQAGLDVDASTGKENPALALARQQQYDRHFRKGETAMRVEQYGSAATHYENAKAIKPEESSLLDPKIARARKLQKEADNLLAADLKRQRLANDPTALNAAYDEYLKAGDQKMKVTDYEEAIHRYKLARTIKPNSPIAGRRIVEARQKMDAAKVLQAQLDEEYQSLIQAGDKLVGKRSYKEALERYREARILKPNESASEDKILEVTSKMTAAEVLQTERIDRKFDNLIKTAKNHERLGEMEKAKTSYELALDLKPKSRAAQKAYMMASEKIEAKTQKLARDNEVKELLQEGDILMDNFAYGKAVKLYAAALDIQPTNQVLQAKYKDALAKSESKTVAQTNQPIVTESATAENAVLLEQPGIADEDWPTADPRKQYTKEELIALMDEQSARIEALEKERKKAYQNKVERASAKATPQKSNQPQQGKVQRAVVSYSSDDPLSKEERATKAEKSWENKRLDEVKNNSGDFELEADEERLDEQGLIYRVQLASAGKPLATDYFSKKYGSGIEPQEIFYEGLYRYVTGEFKKYSNATRYKNAMISEGVANAFLIIFYNGKRISLEEALQIEEQ